MSFYVFSLHTQQTQNSIKNYNEIWKDLRVHPYHWKRVLLPKMTNLDMGASEAIYSSLRSDDVIVEQISPIVYMRAEKNMIEREGMRRAHVKDAVAMCDTFTYLDDRVS
jgi:Xaa-Pro aminopeptidase